MAFEAANSLSDCRTGRRFPPRIGRLDRRIIMGMNRNLVIATLAQVERDIREGERHLSVNARSSPTLASPAMPSPFVAL